MEATEKRDTRIGMVNRWQYMQLQQEDPNFKIIEESGEDTTVPHQSMSIKEMILKYQVSGNMPAAKQAYYDTEVGYTGYEVTMDRNFDLADHSMMVAQLQDDYTRMQQEQAEAERSEEEAKNAANLTSSTETEPKVQTDQNTASNEAKTTS